MYHLECSVCEELMENPTTLPCGHSFCRDKCLVQWLKQKEAASCPVCREPIPSTPLRVNIALRDAIEIAKNSKQDAAICFECEEAPATLFCGDCDASYCEECSSALHRPKAFRSHSIVPINQKPTISSSKCPRHPSKPLEHFCTKCLVSICDSCGLLMGHAKHCEELIPLLQAKEDFGLQVKELHLSLSNATSKVSGNKEEVEKVVAEVLVNTQTILYDLINNLVRESSQKIFDVTTGNTVSCSLTFDKELREKGNEFIENALEVLKGFKQSFNESFEFIEENAKSFHLKLLSKLVKKDLVDVEVFDVSSKSKEILKIAQISDGFSINFSELQELVVIEIHQELKLKLLNNFINNSQTISISQFNWIKEINPELNNLMFETLELNSLTEEEFLALVGTFIEHSNVELLSKVINIFSFESVPVIPVIPGNLLSRINVDNVSNQNREIWLEKVILKNLVGEEIQVIGRKLLGREIPLRINVGVWVYHQSLLYDLTDKIKKGFAENWGNVNLSINSFTSKVQSFEELDNYDVLVVESLDFPCPGQFLDQFLNQGKGLVLFNCSPSNIQGGFSNSCFNEAGRGSYITNQKTQHDMVKTLPNDPIFLNVNSFSINCGFPTQKSVNGTLLATVNSGIPLIAKKEVGGGRLVEFGFFCVSKDGNPDGWYWPSSTDGHKLFANSIIWVNKMV
ncbi:hypothetical protein GEMRC1_009870 [Eukaryota sp. GEM-RC1]